MSYNSDGSKREIKSLVELFLCSSNEDAVNYGLPSVVPTTHEVSGIFREDITLFRTSVHSRNGRGDYRTGFLAFVIEESGMMIPMQLEDENSIIFWNFPEGADADRKIRMKTALISFQLYHFLGSGMTEFQFNERLRSVNPIHKDYRRAGIAGSYSKDPESLHPKYIVVRLDDEPDKPREIEFVDDSSLQELLFAIEEGVGIGSSLILNADSLDTAIGSHPIREVREPPRTDISLILEKRMERFRTFL